MVNGLVNWQAKELSLFLNNWQVAVPFEVKVLTTGFAVDVEPSLNSHLRMYSEVTGL